MSLKWLLILVGVLMVFVGNLYLFPTFDSKNAFIRNFGTFLKVVIMLGCLVITEGIVENYLFL